MVDVWVKAGAIAELEAWSGMAHFLEHMIFKGTGRLPPGKFDQIIENRGGLTNAATSHDYAHYYINTAASDLSDTLPCLAELLINAAIPDEEFALEREVVLEEIRQSQDDPDGLGFQALMETIYQRHPYGRPVLGSPEALMALSPQEMRCFHRAHYQPENMTVVVVGDVAWESALELVDQSFNFTLPAVCPKPEILAEPPLTQIRRQELCLPRLEQARLMMAWTGPGVEDIRSAYGLDLLSVLLAGGRTARLVRELREERQLVQDIGGGFSLQRHSSLFTLTAWLEPQYLAQVEAIIGDRLSELAAVPVSEVELNRYKRLLCNDYAFSTETASQIAGLYGYYNTIAQAHLAIRYPEVIQSFQPEELRQLASQYLSPLRYAATVLIPEG
ncbi:MAG: insulinase family protein [Oscillatoriophycideae cyanobacterium NC_groundwater_1537_Pr4_S-0.65um_50_18]|nr:insulinase family protein [Oscillatoriophycideae cyanobacterium NC_groundwater_1537_Pr4_S-0.65um_50_18]